MTKSKLISNPKELKCGDKVFVADAYDFSDETSKVGIDEQYFAYDAIDVVSVKWVNHKAEIKEQYMLVNEGENDEVGIPLVNTNVSREKQRVFVSELDAVKYTTDMNAQVAKSLDAKRDIIEKTRSFISERLDQDAEVQKELETQK